LANVLERIVEKKREEIAARRQACPLEALREQVQGLPATRGFFDRLASPGPIKLIAEFKRKSPSKGIIREGSTPSEIAKIYEANGATCMSVLTDEPFFGGTLDDLREARAAVDLPIIRKDFILDPYQLYEARLVGADAVLLIAECLDSPTLAELLAGAEEVGLSALVELYDPENAERIVASGAKLIGVNNRDLRSFEVDLRHTLRMRERIPADRLLVGESGIRSRADVELLAEGGVDAILVGETLMASADVGAAVRELLGR
jgi:indole-3-glycerol phosphate synthase